MYMQGYSLVLLCYEVKKLLHDLTWRNRISTLCFCKANKSKELVHKLLDFYQLSIGCNKHTIKKTRSVEQVRSQTDFSTSARNFGINKQILTYQILGLCKQLEC